MIKDLAHIAINVADMEKSIAFYEKALGGKKVFSFADTKGNPWIEYVKLAPNSFVELFYNRQGENSGSFNHMCFEVDDIQVAAQMILDAGAPLTTAPTMGCDGNWQCWTVNPDGNRIELMQYGPDAPQLKKY